VISNTYAMNHDESIYSLPGSFNPDRYIPKEEGGREEPFPVGGFGFGRRYKLLRPISKDLLTMAESALGNI